MIYPETVMQLPTDPGQQLGMCDRIVVRYMRRKCVDTRRDRPDMKIVDAAYAGRFSDRHLDGRQVYMPWRTLEQDIYGLHYEPPCTDDDDHADEDAAQRVCPQETECGNEHTGDYRRHRSEQIADHVKERSPHVQIVFMSGMKQPGRDDIHYQAAGRYDDQLKRRDLRRRLPSLDRFVNYPDREEDEGDTVDERRKNLEPIIAVSFF